MNTYDPNGNNWVSSDSMGKRLLIKAGWSNGEGLGKYKQGSNVHIKVSLKNEKDGIGLKSGKRENDLSLMQCFTFDNILKSKYGKSAETNNEGEKQMERGLSRARFGRSVPKEFFNPVASDDLNKILCKSKVDKKKEELPTNNIKKPINEGNASFFSSYTVFEYFSMKMKLSNIKSDNLNGLIFNKLDSVKPIKKSDTNDLENQQKKFDDKDHNSLESNTNKSKIDDLLTPGKVSMKKKKSEKIDENLSENISKTKIKSLKTKNESVKEEHKAKLDSEYPKISKSKKKSKVFNAEFEITNGEKSIKQNETLIVENILSEQIISENLIKKISKKKSKKRKLTESEDNDCKNKKFKEIQSVTLDSSLKVETAENHLLTTKFSAKSSVYESIEIVENSNFCPWNTSNINEIEGYKYY